MPRPTSATRELSTNQVRPPPPPPPPRAAPPTPPAVALGRRGVAPVRPPRVVRDLDLRADAGRRRGDVGQRQHLHRLRGAVGREAHPREVPGVRLSAEAEVLGLERG